MYCEMRYPALKKALLLGTKIFLVAKKKAPEVTPEKLGLGVLKCQNLKKSIIFFPSKKRD